MQIHLQHSILKVLVYFDLFNYPVSEDEIFLFLDRKADRGDLARELRLLTLQGMIFKVEEFYSLRFDPNLVIKRLEENKRAQQLLQKARRISRFLFLFPYVRAVGISGSLSKNVADEKADIDYFIVTRSNRLWVARTFMHLFKKLTFIIGRQHWYCMNYYVDEKGMEIEEKNIFTATELITLMPMHANGAVDAFFEANDWARKYFPNNDFRSSHCPAPGSGMKNFLESILNGSLGNKLEKYFMKLTSRRWSNKEENFKLNLKGNRMGMRSGQHYCKPNPAFFHHKVLSDFNRRLLEIERKWNQAGNVEHHQLVAPVLRGK